MSEFRPGRFQVLPLVIKNLLIINGLVWLAQVTLQNMYDIDLTRKLGLFYWESEYFRVYQLFTHMFLHDDRNIWHLASNMFILWMFGSRLENVWGSKRFLIFYIICGIGSAVLYMCVLTWEFHQLTGDVAAFFDNATFDGFLRIYKSQNLSSQELDSFIRSWAADAPESPGKVQLARLFLSQLVEQTRNTVTVGASGAIYGILFAFGYLFGNTLVMLFLIPFPIKVKYVIGGLIIWELILGVQNAANDNVAHFAHLGGALIGFILLKIWNKRIRRDFY